MPSLPELSRGPEFIVTGQQMKSNFRRPGPSAGPLTGGGTGLITAPVSRFYLLRPVCQICFPENHVNLRRALISLAAAALLLPIVTVILVGFGRLLAAMNDGPGALVVDRVALAVGIAWATDLVTLIIVQAIHSAGPSE
jgi:hypothetical protein